MCEAIETVETDIMLSHEIHERSSKLADLQDQSLIEVEDPVRSQGSEDESEPQEPVEKKPRCDACPRTLGGILSACGMKNFVPENDSEEKMLGRIEQMCPFFDAFTALVRCSEGILSKASVAGHGPKPREQWIHEHELSLARAEFHCSAQRQSRHSLWAQYSERVSQVVAEMATSQNDPLAADASTEVKVITPNSFSYPNGQRACQVLIVRVCKAGGDLGPLRLAVVVATWRGGRAGEKRKAKDYIWTEGSLPIQASTRVHVKLLRPEGVQNESGWHLCTATSVSSSLCLDPQDGSIIRQIPPACFEYSYEATQLKVWVSKASVRVIGHLNKTDIPFTKTKSQKDPVPTTFFTDVDFNRTERGSKNMGKYLEQMRRDYETHFKQIVGDDGKLQVRSDIDVLWEEMVVRIPSYFKRYLHNHAHFKTLSKCEQEMSFLGFDQSLSILICLRACVFLLAVFYLLFESWESPQTWKWILICWKVAKC